MVLLTIVRAIHLFSVCLSVVNDLVICRELTYKTLWPVFRVDEVDEDDVRGADEEGEEPDDEHHQQRVPCRQAGSQRVEDAHVPQQSDQAF